MIIRKLHIKQTGEEAALVYMDELTDKTCLNHDVLAPLQLESGNPSEDSITNVGYVKPESKWDELKLNIMLGKQCAVYRRTQYRLCPRGLDPETSLRLL
nr:spore germination protein [Paenibacillus sp. ISL-20]